MAINLEDSSSLTEIILNRNHKIMLNLLNMSINWNDLKRQKQNTQQEKTYLMLFDLSYP